MKVHDLATKLGQRNKEFMRFLNEVAIKVKSPNTKLDPETVEIIKDLFTEKNSSHLKKISVDPLENKTIHFPGKSMILKEFAKLLQINLSEILKVLLQRGFLLNINSEIDSTTAVEVGKILNFDIITNNKENSEKSDTTIKDHLNKIEESELEKNIDDLITRPPVITIMGHVDHGKTLLLDTIRKTNVADGEAGGITQHIGAYQVTIKKRKLTFLDTPGHEAFTTLRARGAQVTDITILVVAAEEGIKPQTIEAINHAKAAKVPIIVAVNKMDKPEANFDRCKQMLSDQGLVAEDWGGDTIIVPVSAKAGTGLDELLDMIMLVADMQELKANPKRPAQGIIIESKLSRKKGPVATILVKSGTLKVGDHFVVGSIAGKVRSLLNDKNTQIHTVPPGTPAEIMGLPEVPRPGDLLEVMPFKNSKEQANQTSLLEKDSSQKSISQVSFENLSKQVISGELKKLNIVLKADVNGSLEAVLHSLTQLPNDEVSINILHSATGPITENDIMLARASDGIVLGFGVTVNTEAKRISEEEKIQIKVYSIIYEMLDDIKRVVQGLFKVEYEEIELATIEVRQLFKFSKIGVIAGCFVLTGKVIRNIKARVIRDNAVIFEGKISSLKRFKEDIKDVQQGYECGIVMDGFTDFQASDKIICFELREKAQKF